VALNALGKTEKVAADATRLTQLPLRYLFYKETVYTQFYNKLVIILKILIFLFLKIASLKESLAKATSEDVKSELQKAIDFGVTRLTSDDMRTSILKCYYSRTSESQIRQGNTKRTSS
jgi:hypothetical protein